MRGTELKSWYVRHERSLVSSFLVAGFLLDFLTFRTLSIEVTLICLAFYLVMAAMCIIFVFVFDARHLSWGQSWLRYVRMIAPLLTQLAFGSLLSMSLLFYWFSGSFSVSWPVFVFLISSIIFNESFRNAYLRPVVQVALFTFVLFSFFALLFPYLFNSLDASVVLLGGGVSLIFSLLFIFSLVRAVPALRPRVKLMLVSVSVVFLVMQSLYFLNLIPPLPLSLREAGMYYRIERVGGTYLFEGEEESFVNRFLPGQILRQGASERVYAYTSVYSPADLDTVIFHVWEYYDVTKQAWVKTDRLSFFITGGRVDGYRGFTYKSRLMVGKWRVSVETERGQVLGRIRFTYEKRSP